MKLPRYMNLKVEKGFNYTLTIKRWGVPHFLYKILRDRFNLKWYHWITFYPYLCVKVVLRGGISNV